MANKSTVESSLKTVEGTKTRTPMELKTTIPLSHSDALNKYVRSVGAMNRKTAYEYYLRLIGFQDFLTNNYNASLDAIIQRINDRSEDPYGILSDYITYLQTNYNISTLTIKNRIITAKNFLEYYDVDISPKKFKLKVKIPKVVRRASRPYQKKMSLIY